MVPSNLCYLKFRKYPPSAPPISHIKTMQCKSYTNFSLFPTGGLIKNIICSRERERERLLFEIPKIPLHTKKKQKKVINFFFTLRLINCLEYLFSAEKMHVYTHLGINVGRVGNEPAGGTQQQNCRMKEISYSFIHLSSSYTRMYVHCNLLFTDRFFVTYNAN